MLGGPNDSTLFMVVQEWRDTEHKQDGARTRQVLTVQAPAARPGWP